MEDNTRFTQMVDYIVEMGEDDQELKEALKWVDNNNRIKGDSFYDKIFEILYNHEINQRAKLWLEEKRN